MNAGAPVPLPVGFNYVLILEWLAEGEARTGAELRGFLQAIGFPSELVVCHSWDDIEAALLAARAAVVNKGPPVVHLETHGADPWAGPAEEGVRFGPWADSAPAWARFGALLAPLNVSAGFQLLIVSAACWGSAVIAAIDGGDHSAPFACAVGFRTAVTEGRLRDCMRELYRCLRAGSTLAESVASAQLELAAGQALHLEVIVELAAKMLGTLARQRRSFIGPLRWLRNARLVWDAWFPPELQDQVPAYRFQWVNHALLTLLLPRRGAG